MAPRRIVVVGASLAGLRAAQAVRAAGHDGELVVIGAEGRLPYTRPPLSKELLAGAHEPGDCALDCSALDATWRTGETAVALDLAARTIALAGGETVAYDRAILATGCRARAWTGEGAGLDGVFTLRDLDDALALRAALRRAPAPRVAIVGAGFVGCEVAATARRHGCHVTLIDVAPLPLAPLGGELGRRCAELHAAHGVGLRLDVGVAALAGEDGRVTRVDLADGSRVAADVVVVALGAVPNVDWLESSGLALARGGVACDATLSAAPDVLCAGDIATWPHPLADGEPVRVEHWTNAVEQGTAAGRNALLDPPDRAPYEAVPYFWTDQYDVKLQAVGFPARAEHVEVVEESAGGDRFVAVGVRDGRAVAAIAWNAMRRLSLYRRALAQRPSVEQLRATLAADGKALGAPAAGAPA